ncbi:hypothetical protein GGX14DRAFT_464340 [Mycena pura]|uniref:Uncharacterized protein n=1 Tax=Mycena pura TaxID=153505 RepID=A0AAD6YC06_9AGAR|nr:hypothetical protein GGX14DRAFT_464340 [Mycena pura]
MEESETQDLNDPEPEPQTSRVVASSLSAIDQQRFNLWILTQKDRPMLSLEDMKKFLELDEETATRSRLAQLEEHFEDDLERLYMAEAQDQLDDLNDFYCSFEGENDELQALSVEARKPKSSHLWDYIFSHTNQTYQQRLVDIRRGRSGSKPQMDFPKSIDEYRQRPKETQQRVARFLLLESDDQREQMMAEFGWPWRDVMPLQEAFETNTEFQERIRTVLIEPSNTVTADPRKAVNCALPSAAAAVS